MSGSYLHSELLFSLNEFPKQLPDKCSEIRRKLCFPKRFLLLSGDAQLPAYFLLISLFIMADVLT